MPYLGQIPTNGFHTKQTISGDGSTVTFTLNHTVGNESSLVVSVDGTILEPKHGYDLAGGGSKITFATAPASNVRTYVQFLGQAVVNNLLDMNGTELVLDEDADTSLTADTDDEIDIKVAGSDRSTIKATGFHNLDSVKFVAGTGDDMQMYHDGSNSYLTNSTGALKLATETSGIAITLGHSTSEVTVGDNLTVTGDLTVGGNANFGDFNITNVGSIALDTITNDGTDITLDSSGDIILDAGGNDLIFKDSGTEIGRFANTSSDLVIKSAISDQDLILKGIDGGSEISALTFDMSAAGKATFNDQVVIGDGKLVLGSTAVTSTAAELNLLDGVSGLVQADLTKLAAVDSTAAEINLLNGVSGLVQADLTKLAAIDATAAEINLIDGGTARGTTAVADADGILHNDDGTMRMTSAATFKTYFQQGISTAYDDLTAGDAAVLITTSSGNITIDAAANDSDIILKGTDGNADTTFLTIDGSAAGEATFNAGIVIADAGNIGSASDKDAIAIASDGVVTFTQKPVINSGVAIDNITIDGTEIDLSSGDLTVDVAGDIILDAGGGDFKFQDDGTHILSIVNSSSDVIIKPIQDNKDIIFQQRDGTEVARVGNNANFSIKDNLNMNSDASQINFGADADISLIHYHNAGLILKNNVTSDDTPPHLILSNGETAIDDGDFLGTIQFDAPDEASGTDAILISAAIDVIAEADFTASVNKTKMTFRTATSGVATTKLSILNDGRGLSPFTARAWAQWDGTTVQSSHNVSSVANPSTGKYTVNYANNMPNNDYATAGMTHADRFIAHENAPTTSDIDLVTYNSGGSLEAGNYNNIIIFSTGT